MEATTSGHPAEAATRAGSRPARRPDRARQGPVLPRVILSDPDSDVLQSMGLLVKRLGYDAVLVPEPADLLDAVEREPPALVIVEPQYPGLNLAGFVAALASHEATAHVPVVFCSASRDLAATAQRHGVWGTLAKPFATRELATLLERSAGPSPLWRETGRERSMERDVRQAFQEYRNLVTALSNYVALLEGEPGLSAEAHEAVRRLADLELRMEAKVEHLRNYVLSLLRPSVAPEAEPAPRRTRRPAGAREPTQVAGRLARGPGPSAGPAPGGGHTASPVRQDRAPEPATRDA